MDDIATKKELTIYFVCLTIFEDCQNQDEIYLKNQQDYKTCTD